LLAFEYLKDNPQVRANQIKYGWHDLFADPECPYSVKQELLELEKLGVPTTDPVLYFHSLWTMEKFIKGKTLDDEIFKRAILKAEWSNGIYWYLQQEPDCKDNINDLWERFLNQSQYVPDGFTKSDVFKACQIHCNEHRDNMLHLCFYALHGKPYNVYDLVYHQGSEDTMLGRLFDYMSLDFIRRSPFGTINQAIDLFNDVYRPTDGKRYASLTELEKAHEERTAAEVRKMLKENPRRLIYTTTFKDIVTKNGFKLPMSKNDLIERGARHHNCVATYADKHCSNPASYATSFTRLIFAPDATAELKITAMHGLITSVTIPQYKGRYNKDVAIPLELCHVQIELTGQDIGIIRVEEERKDDEN
jgi:hypothetical protein